MGGLKAAGWLIHVETQTGAKLGSSIYVQPAHLGAGGRGGNRSGSVQKPMGSIGKRASKR